MDASCRASGAVLGFHRARRDLDGFNLDISWKMAEDIFIDAHYKPATGGLEFSSFLMDLWYQIRFFRYGTVAAGYSMEMNSWSYEDDEAETIDFDRDNFSRFYFSFSFSF
jgi:hypothetical protein